MKAEQLKMKDQTDSGKNHGMARRDFFKLVGGGIFIFLRPFEGLSLPELPADQRRTLPQNYNAFLRIAEDGTVTCYTGKVEMGQGIITSLPQMMADELDVSIEKIKMVMGDTDLCPYDQGTWGSLTTRVFGPFMRAAAAEAKMVLVGMAAASLEVPASQLEVVDGKIIDTKNPSKSVTYGQLSKGQKIERYLDVKPSVEDYKKFKYVGKSYTHSDAVLKVTGQAIYTGDMKMPGMVFARILRPPSHGAKMISVDVSGAEKVAGTKVVRDGDLIAVLNENHDRADEALAKIKAEYSYNELKVNHKTLFDRMLNAGSAVNVLRSEGDIEAGRKLAEKTFESEFRDPYVAHAPLETHTALANIENGKLTVWASAQSPFGLQDMIVRELGYSLDKVRVIVPFIGGGFGGKSMHQQGVEAARLTKLAGKPVMLVWTRDEEFFYDNYHPAGVVKVKSGIDKMGNISFWDYNIYYSGSRGSDTLYNVPNSKTTQFEQKEGSEKIHPFGTGPWRAPNNNTNTFARESQIDIMAAAAGIDPLEFRLKNLKDEHLIGCLKAIASKFGYVPGKIPGGRGIGMAMGTDAGAWVALMAEVKVDKATGKIEVVRIGCAQDMGLCVNPQGSIIQMEGCLMMGLGYTLAEEISFEGGNIQNRNFDSYNIPHFSWMPQLITVILDKNNEPPQGGGEPPIIGVGAAVANAVFDATGARLYQMPFTPERVLEALKKVT